MLFRDAASLDAVRTDGKERRVIQSDLRFWDCRHQVLATRLVPPWRVLLWLKATELAVQLRARSLRRLAALPDPDARAVMRWYYSVGKRVWPHEVWNFLFREKRRRDGPTLNEFWGPPLDAEEAAMRCRLTVSKGARHIVNQAKIACSTIAPATKSLLPSSRCHRPRQSTHLPPKPPHRQIPVVTNRQPGGPRVPSWEAFGRRP